MKVAGAVSLALALLCVQAPARAQDAKASAEVLFDEGRKAMAAHDYPVACAKFRESLKIDPGVGAMLWLGDCYEQSGLTASAWALFREAESAARTRHDPTREKVAARRAQELEPKLSTLTVEVEESVPGLSILRDEIEVGPTLRGVSVPIDPGPHVIKATAPGYRAWMTRSDIAGAGAKNVVRVPKLVPAEEQAVAPVAPAKETPSVAPASSWTTQKTVALVSAGLGVVALGAGGYLGLTAIDKKDESNADGHCGPGNACDATGIRLRDEADTSATISTIAFAVGATLIVGGAILWFTSPKPARTTAVLTF